MKNSKKLIALVLAMVMIFALTASALAATNSTMTVYVTIKGVLSDNELDTVTICTEKDYTITSSSTVYNLIQTLSDTDSPYAHNAVWKTVDIIDTTSGNQTGTAKALTSLSCTTTGNYMGYDATYEYVWGGNSRMVQYDIVDTFSTIHRGNYVGTDWVYSVKRGDATVEPTVYMDQYTLQDGDHVTLTYKYDNFSWSNTDWG